MTIVEKIKALLAKASSTDNENEAALFLGKAHELMEKHQLDSSDLEADDPIDQSIGGRANGGASPDWDFQLMFAVAPYFGCKAIQCLEYEGRKPVYRMRIVGRESARVTAIEMHKYLVASVRRLGREHAKVTGQNAGILQRRIGRALSLRINEMTPDDEVVANAPSTAAGKNALVTLNGTLAKYNELFPKARAMGGTVLTSANAERIAGGINLNLQTGHSPKALLR
jgi:hypothetical protein